MYKYTNKHVELLKKIPFQEFSSNADFIKKVLSNPNKYGTYENILKCYYFISEEMWNPDRKKPLVRYNDKESRFYFYDFVKKKPNSISDSLYKKTKLLNSVLDKDGKNRHCNKYYGLIVKNKPNVPKSEVKRLREDFLKFAYQYDKNYPFYQRQKFEIPDDWLEHLYNILYELCEKADFFYKQRGCFILAQEMANILSNQYIISYSANLIKMGYNRKKLIRQIKERKLLMFGELER